MRRRTHCRCDPPTTRTRLQHRNDSCKRLLIDAIRVGNHHREVIAVGQGHHPGHEKHWRSERFNPHNPHRLARVDVLPDSLRKLGSPTTLLAFEHYPISVAATSLDLLTAAPPRADA